MARRRLDASEYTVGWICALPIELAAAQVMLDEEHLPHAGVNSAQYTLGRIGSHNVVLACLPAGQMGIGAAAFSAGQATSIFTSICFTMMVGVGGGAPSTDADVRLGDVVVSQPVREHSGVVQYDFGKTGKDGRMTRTGSLNAPSKTLLHAVAQLRAYRYQDGRTEGSLATHLSVFGQHANFSRDKAGPDVLFESSYHHDSGATCERCSENKMVRRTARSAGEEVTIHYGTIASGNQVIKDGTTRDRLSKELGGVLCFEMEAAGLMNDFPCLVVRGICDYADSHKNKTWQPYAAATAAACAKAILSLVPTVEVLKTATVGEALKYRVPFSLKGVPVIGKFAERPKDTEALERALLQQRNTKERNILVLHGLGGMGKTQLAVNFARRHQNSFSSVLWLDGSGESKLKQSFAVFASRIPIGQISETSRLHATTQSGNIDAVVKDVLSWLSLPDNNNWMMVIDNVDRDDRRREEDNEAYNVEEYIPEADHGSTLITTRLLHLGQLAERWEARKVDKKQARAIFGTLYNKDVGDDAEELLELLDGLPLALAQAAAYMNETGTDFSTYTRLYKEQWPKLMNLNDSKRLPLRNYGNGTVATTWTISYTAVRQENEAAANLLLLWAHLDNKGLWHYLLAEGSQYDEIIAGLTQEWLGEIAHSETRFLEAIKILRSYSLVEEAEDQTGYSTHPVVHQWALSMQDDEQRAALSCLSVILVGHAIPDDRDKNSWETETRLLPHADRCMQNVAKAIERVKIEFDLSEKHEQTLLAITYLGDLYHRQSIFVKAEEAHMLVLENGRHWTGERSEVVLRATNRLGELYRLQGKFSKAEGLLIQALEGRKKVLGEHHNLTLSTIRNLSIVYAAQGKLDQAAEMLMQALESHKKVYLEVNDHRLQMLHSLGTFYSTQGKLDEAEDMYMQALEGQRKLLGAGDPETIHTISNLGSLYIEQDKFEKAEEMLTQALERYTKIVGPESVLTYTPALHTMEHFGCLYEELDRLDDARTWYSKALSGFGKVYGPDHPDCQRLRNNLAKLDKTEKRRNLSAPNGRSDQDKLIDSANVSPQTQPKLGQPHRSNIDTVGSPMQQPSPSGLLWPPTFSNHATSRDSSSVMPAANGPDISAHNDQATQRKGLRERLREKLSRKDHK